MTTLDELLKMSSMQRRHRLASAHQALVELGVDGGVAWLEEHLDSPVGPEWGSSLYRLRPEWRHIERWLQLDKLHCIAAVDALNSFSAATPPPDGESPEMPKGADARSINQALDSALSSFGNPRIEDAARRIRHVWPSIARKPIPVTVPTALQKVAQHLLGEDGNLKEEWEKSMAAELDPPSSSLEVYSCLLDFADKHNAVAIVDWKEFGDNILGRVRELKSAKGLNVSWDKLDLRGIDTVGAISAISSEATRAGKSMVCLDQGNDDYPLVFLSQDETRQLSELIKSVDDLSVASVWTFYPEEDRKAHQPTSPAQGMSTKRIEHQVGISRSQVSSAEKIERSQSLPWYVWVLMILGVIVGVLWEASKSK